MPFAYTVCSLNHVPFAMALGRSILKHDPGSRFYIGLIDQVNGRVELPQVDGVEFIEVEGIGIDAFDDMSRRYTVFEFACACKPFFAKHIFDTVPDIEKLLYFDTDILSFASLVELESKLNEHNIVLTPHITKPLAIEDGLYPNDENFTGAGIYNGGFFGLRRSDETFRFLGWWSERLKTKASVDFEKGYFVDQSWLGLAPLFFDGVHIERGPQFNAAYWNLHERKLTNREGQYFVNDLPLVFYHFSGYRLSEKEKLSIYQNRYSFAALPALKALFEHYSAQVEKERLSEFVDLEPAFGPDRVSKFKKKLRTKLENRIKRLG